MIGTILGWFGISKIAMIVGLIAAGIGGFALWTIQSQNDTIETLRGNQRVLTQSIELQKNTIDTLIEDRARFQQQIEQVSTRSNESAERVENLAKMFADHDLANLADNKPGLIQRRINDAIRKFNEETEALTSQD